MGEFHVQEAVWQKWTLRFAAGEWRTHLFSELVARECEGRPPFSMTVVDVGCGHGFDGDEVVQRELGKKAKRFIGIEPDSSITLDPCFHETYRSLLELTPIQLNSVDLGYSVMVLEHVSDAEQHWEKIHSILRPGGVFWGFTVDGSHWFTWASRVSEIVGIKNRWLDFVAGRRGTGRYENYPTYYLSNTPTQINELTAKFARVDVIFFRQRGQAAAYFPKGLRWLGFVLDWLLCRDSRRGMNFAVRAQK